MRRRDILLLGFAACLILAVSLVIANRNGQEESDISTISKKDALAEYDYMWEILRENYPFLGMAGRKLSIDVDALEADYREKIEAMEGKRIDFVEYYQALRKCIGNFQELGHLSVLSPGAYDTEYKSLSKMQELDIADKLNLWKWENVFNAEMTQARYAFLNEGLFKGSQGRQASQEGFSTDAPENLTFEEIDEEIGYVKINSFRTQYIENDRDQLKAWFDANANKKYIIIDIAGNGGGHDAYWKDAIVAPNIDEELTKKAIFHHPIWRGNQRAI